MEEETTKKEGPKSKPKEKVYKVKEWWKSLEAPIREDVVDRFSNDIEQAWIGNTSGSPIESGSHWLTRLVHIAKKRNMEASEVNAAIVKLQQGGHQLDTGANYFLERREIKEENK